MCLWIYLKEFFDDPFEILDKLKESSFKKFMINETRKDQKEIDEISATISIKSKKDN